jgi:ATP-dependent helicase HrpB
VRLPIDPLLPEILDHLRREPTLVLEAPTGAGKTTRVPRALLDLDEREVVVLEPRRLAARLAARFVAHELGEAVGGTVGYQVRFDEVAGPRTRLRFVTEGVLTRKLLSDPMLARVGTVVLDEFHERHLEGDLALALLRKLQRTRRPELRIVVMSATLDAAPVAEFLGAGLLRSEGRQFPLEIEYTPSSAAALDQQVAAALERLEAAGNAGHTLVFLPGAAEIRRAQAACAAWAQRTGRLLLPLHGDQSPEEQDRAVSASAQPKIILSTNVAESSVTIDGVTAVVDSGLARVAEHSPWSGLPALQVKRISQASANQRAGRAGRTAPGRVIRLYPLEDFVRRPAQETPEVLREDLAPAALLVSAMAGARLTDLEWLDAPPADGVAHAEDLLSQLGAGGATAREMARYPLHPRLARLIVEAERRGVGEEGRTAAAVLSAGARLPDTPAHASRSDVFALMEGRWDQRTAQTVRQISRMAGGARAGKRLPAREREEALLIAILTAFPDRVARRRSGSDLQMAQGGPARLAPSSTVTGAEFVVAVEAEDRKDQSAPLVRIASAIEPECLIDMFPERVREVAKLEWNRAAERVESVSALMFGQIAIEESRGVPDPGAAAELLAAKALESGFSRFTDVERLNELLERMRFSAHNGAFPEPGENAVEVALRSLATGLKSFTELETAARGAGLTGEIERSLLPAERRLLDEIAPEKIRLPGGRFTRVHYEPGQPPWIASRLQDFFGMTQTPRVGRGAVPVVVRLLAPNQRPVQMTTDLAGFWERLYPQVRRELARRYPKHAWPEKPNPK